MIIRAVIFDLDGTITDTIPLTVYSLKEVARELTGREWSDQAILEKFGPIDTEIIKMFVDNERREESSELYIKHFAEHFERFVKPMDGITDLLRFLKEKGLKVGLFTGRSLRGTDIVLEKLNIRQYFDIIIAGDFTRQPKPDPEGIHMALEKLGVKPEEGVYVGDFDVDIRASKAAGTKSVLALWSSTGSERHLKENPDQSFRSPHMFIEWLQGEL